MLVFLLFSLSVFEVVDMTKKGQILGKQHVCVNVMFSVVVALPPGCKTNPAY